VIAIIGLVTALVIGSAFLSAFVIMIVWGAIAGIFDGPTISYWMAFVVGLALSLLKGGIGISSFKR